jgi:hypothetical protein
MAFPFVGRVWGGATAIRRQDFENWGVKEVWAKTAVDDMTLQKIINEKKQQTLFMLDCITEAYADIASVKHALQWYKRQLFYLKYYQTPVWLAFGFLLVFIAVNTLALLPLALSALLTGMPVLIQACLLAGGLTILVIFSGILTKARNSDRFGLPFWGLLSPLLYSLTGISFILTLFTNKMYWGGIMYTLGKKGKILKIER